MKEPIKEQHGPWFRPRPRPKRPDVACLKELPENVPARASQPVRTTQAHPSLYTREIEPVSRQTEPLETAPRMKRASGHRQRRVCPVQEPEPKPHTHTRRGLFAFGVGALATLGGLFIVPQLEKKITTAFSWADANVSQLDIHLQGQMMHLFSFCRNGQVLILAFPGNYDVSRLKVHTFPYLLDGEHTPSPKVTLQLETFNGMTLLAVQVEGNAPFGLSLDPFK